jgi:hypothetical protein
MLHVWKLSCSSDNTSSVTLLGLTGLACPHDTNSKWGFQVLVKLEIASFHETKFESNKEYYIFWYDTMSGGSPTDVPLKYL